MKWWLLIVTLVLAGCSTLSGETETSEPAQKEEAQTDPSGEGGTASDIPSLDTNLHSVPLEEIFFDTFRPIDRAVPLTEAEPELIEDLQDAIPPIHDPLFEDSEAAAWLEGDDVVIGYANQGGAWAFPIRILNFHEIVNTTLGGKEVLISYCPLCYSAVVYDRWVDDRLLNFGNTSALYESDMVMLDYETGSYWWQVAGEAIVGPLTGSELKPLPSLTTTWRSWLELHPGSLVLSRETGFDRDYGRDIFDGYEDYLNQGNFAFPVSEAGQDGRLPPSAKVLALQVGDAARAYPLIGDENTTLMDSLNGQEIVVFIRPQDQAGQAFIPVLDGQRLSFEVQAGQFFDQETRSRWDLSGRAIEGELTGERLEALPSKLSFWFAIVAAAPEITIYGAE